MNEELDTVVMEKNECKVNEWMNEWIDDGLTELKEGAAAMMAGFIPLQTVSLWSYWAGSVCRCH